jgi:hypothetical protein
VWDVMRNPRTAAAEPWSWDSIVLESCREVLGYLSGHDKIMEFEEWDYADDCGMELPLELSGCNWGHNCLEMVV